MSTPREKSTGKTEKATRQAARACEEALRQLET